MKVSKFEEIIWSSVVRLRGALEGEELLAFEDALPKKIKELTAEPYFFVFEAMLRRKELVDHALLALGSMIEENYIAYPLYQRVSAVVAPLVKDYSYQVVQFIQKVKEPHLALIQLFFDIHASVALPQDVLRKFKGVGYGWLSKAFALTDRPLPPFLNSLYSKFYPQEIGQLPKAEEQEQMVERYVGLILGEMIGRVEEELGDPAQVKGKFGVCFLCSKPAHYYCKDTKVSVCSVDCKKAHLQILAKSSSLHSTFSYQFQCSLQNLLINNVASRRSPALSIDFLVAVYLYSNYVPQKTLPHIKILGVPVIFQRIWLLYLSYFGKKNQCCEHILASCLNDENSFLRQMSSVYFLTLAQDPRVLHIYNTFDRSSDFRLLTYVLRTIDQDRRAQMVQHLVKTAFQKFTSSNKISVNDHQRSLIRTLNHLKQLSVEILSELMGEDYEEKVVLLVLRNETEINRQKLGALLIGNESLCRKFLQHIVARKEGAPIDQLLRQIFYFFNVKISDKIYRLFQLLAEVYIPQHPFNQLNFFTYAYFVVMIVTEVNNPAVVQKPTEASLLARVQQFSPDLANNHPQLLKDMLVRVTGAPFRQTARGVLSYYSEVGMKIWEQMSTEEMILMNWQPLYQSALTGGLQVVTIYRICCMLASQPAICQTFLQILVDKLGSTDRDPFLLQAISSIIQTQPNAAGFLWKNILQQARMTTGNSQNQNIHLGLIVHSTQLLTDDNFYQFTRQFCSQFNITEQTDLMVQLVTINLKRVGTVTHLLLNNYEKAENYYLQITLLKRLSYILKYNPQEPLAVILLQMFRSLPVLPITQVLILQALIQMDFDSFPHPHQFWTVVSQKCLELTEENRVAMVEEAMKSSQKCQSYESYLIQKTLNCHRKQLISQQILKNLHKLQPYLNDISRQVLSLFILDDNIYTIASHFQYFVTINSAYDIILKALKNKSESSKLQIRHINSILQVIKVFFKNDRHQVILELDKLPILIVEFMMFNWSDAIQVLRQYIQVFHWNIQNIKEAALIGSSISIVANHLNLKVNQGNIFIQNLEQSINKKQRMKQLNNIINILYNLTRDFQKDIEIRIQLKKYLKSSKPYPPSLLQTSLLLYKTQSKMFTIVEQSHHQLFQTLINQVETVLSRQSQVQSQLKVKSKVDARERIILGEANKDALKYGEMLVEQTLNYLKCHNQLDKKEKGALRRLLLELLIQGFFQEESCSFKALSGTTLAQQINQIFSLLK